MPSNRASIVKDFVTSDLRLIIASVYHSHQYQLESSHVLSIHQSFTATAVTPLQLYILTHAISLSYGTNTNHRNIVTSHPRGTRPDSFLPPLLVAF